jgi:hypothetical protein
MQPFTLKSRNYIIPNILKRCNARMVDNECVM